ncbi:MAG TPA: hypothetical protein PLP99_03490 [Ignavibacteriales bacterium]|nr:hypothetical protein [Ignavibacteriales bacterium]HOL80808.1 hypothetical protein [Ignavibacteriales bacterium]HOM66165.1 hypothetical protein [Ignavibacteriales bacterium]HPP33244.1 hypothetical protein [Ignavibacteriales bacterium]HRR17920.1 hypothetical protein [Ignavibacteriales bacterium]
MKNLLIIIIISCNLFAQTEVILPKNEYLIGDKIEFYIQRPNILYDKIVIVCDTTLIANVNYRSLNDKIAINFGIFKPGKYQLTFQIQYIYNNKIIYFNNYKLPEIKIFPIKVDTNFNIKDIKNPDFNFMDIIMLIFITLTIVIIIILFIKIKNNKNKAKYRSLKSYYHIAVEEITKLQKQKYNENNYKIYYQRFVDIIREYIQNQLDIKALNMTSYEIIDEVNQKLGDQTITSYLNEFFQYSNEIRYGNQIPNDDVKTKLFILAGYILDIINKKHK